MPLSKPFSGVGKNDAATAGGKGASLGEMAQAGIPVPPGFVILSGTFDTFLQGAGLVAEMESILQTVNLKEMGTVERASERIQARILGAEMPTDIAQEVEREFKKLSVQYVAIRSSATAEDSASAAWAGQLDTYLNTTEEVLLKNVQKCWASLFTSRAIFYRFEKGLQAEHISVAVVVQAMVNSETSGIAFSVHPVTEDRNQLIIEAGYGLGEAIVSGQVTPDSYVVSKEPRKIIETTVNTQNRALYRAEHGGNEWKEISEPQASAQVLTSEQILELSDLILKIENHYGFPCDIEWAYENGKFYITQSRPITTLSDTKAQSIVVLSKILEREYSLLYFQLWNTCDRDGLKLFTNQSIKHNLFIVPPRGQGGSVWYEEKELAQLEKDALSMLNNDPKIGQHMIDHFEKCWEMLEPYAKDQKTIQSGTELVEYHKTLTSYWSAMNTVYFRLPNHADIDKEFFDGMNRVREKTQEYTDKTANMLTESFERLFPQYVHLSHHVLTEDILALEKGASPDFLAALEKRAQEGCALLDETLIPLPELNENLRSKGLRLESVDTNASEIKGSTGYKGYAKGKVRVITRKADVSLLQEGEILVSVITDPDYVPAMQKAVAVVTDEGGIMSHAAIVAREMKKPCVIGTKTATQILKDGDEIEVDADAGYVRIIQKAALN